jgi:hypothetical protein
MTVTFRAISAGLLGSMVAVQAPGQPASPCVLTAATSGQLLTIRGRVSRDPHNVSITPAGCGDVVLFEAPWSEWAGLDDLTIGPRFRQDKVYQHFDRIIRETKPRGGYKYDVEVTVTGRLDISDGEELKKANPYYARWAQGGFGSPLPFTRYRIIALWMSDVFWWPEGTPRPERKTR